MTGSRIVSKLYFQYPLGLFDCNENKTQELIALLKKLSNDFIPYKNGNIVEPVFFGGKYYFVFRLYL